MHYSLRVFLINILLFSSQFLALKKNYGEWIMQFSNKIAEQFDDELRNVYNINIKINFNMLVIEQKYTCNTYHWIQIYKLWEWVIINGYKNNKKNLVYKCKNVDLWLNNIPFQIWILTIWTVTENKSNYFKNLVL